MYELNTSANFTSLNPILLKGKLYFATDTRDLRIGDGITRWTSTPSVSGLSVESSIPSLNDFVRYCDTHGRWEHDPIFCFVTVANFASMGATVIPAYQMWIEVNNSTLAATGRIKKGDGITTVANLSWIGTVHSHAESDITNLVSDLGLKAPLTNPTFTGVPAAPTASVGTNTTQIATTAFVQAAFGNLDALIYKGVVACAGNPNYPAADAGHIYKVSTAGKIGGSSGITVEIGDLLLCNTDASVSGNQATVGSNWNIIQSNIDPSIYALTGNGVTNGDSHDHVGGDGGQIDHGGLAGLSDDDHTQYIKHGLSTAENDFLVGSGSNTFIKKTLSETKTLLKLNDTTLGIIYVESALISTQTATPDNDTYYVLYPTASGNDWYGHNNEIAYYNNSIWTFITPIVGQIVYAKDTNRFMYYSANLTDMGSTTRWQYLTSGILPRLSTTLDWQGGFIASVNGIENTPPSGFKYNTTRYIVGNSPTGDWLNNSPGDIVQWDGESQSWITSGASYGNSLIFNQCDGNYYAYDTSDFSWKLVALFSGGSNPVAYDTRIVYDILDSPPSGLPYTYIDIPFIVSDSPSTEFQGFEAQICMYDSTSHWMSLHSPVVDEIVFVQKKMAYYKFDGDYHTWRLYTSQFAISSVTKLDDYSGVSELDSSYHIILCDFSTATALSLPPASSNNKVQFTFKNINVGVVTINPNSTETIENVTSKDINALESCTLLCDGANWWMI